VLVLDTHTLVWTTEGDAQLGRGSRALVERHAARSSVVISSISFCEIAALVRTGRLTAMVDVDDYLEQVLALGCAEKPVDAAIAIAAVQLNMRRANGTVHKDPADRIIVATALALGATLVTADAAMLASVPCVPGLRIQDATA
jgi:PIN domain nuclease of toxin-antitoxin system